MKKIMMSLLVLGIGAQVSFASVETMSEDQMLSSKEEEISKTQTSNPNEARVKKSLLAKIRLAKSGFKDWKRSNPNHEQIRKEFRKISKSVKTQGTPENVALKKALAKCKDNSLECQVILKSTIESIYTNSEIPTFAMKKGFSIIPSSYAGAATSNSCTWNERAYYNQTGGAQYFAGILGADEACGLSFIGPGLGYVVIPNHFQICVGDGGGNNFGLYASANALFGTAVGLTVGEGGVCQILSFNALGFGAFAGAILTDDFGAR